MRLPPKANRKTMLSVSVSYINWQNKLFHNKEELFLSILLMIDSLFSTPINVLLFCFRTAKDARRHRLSQQEDPTAHPR